jgi:hypothetical protein
MEQPLMLLREPLLLQRVPRPIGVPLRFSAFERTGNHTASNYLSELLGGLMAALILNAVSSLLTGMHIQRWLHVTTWA